MPLTISAAIRVRCAAAALVGGMLLALVILMTASPAAAAVGMTAHCPPPLGPAIPSVRSLASFAAALGVKLGSANDQRVFDAAEAAMKASPHGLYVKIAPGRYRLQRLRFGANSGYYADAPQTVILQQVRGPADAREEAFVALDDPYATNWLFWGLTLDGGWRYGRSPYEADPEKDPWLDRQHAISFANAVSGRGDECFRANSPIGAQTPRGRYGELLIANFGGDGLRASGAGSQTASAIQIFRVGGRGMAWTTYDNNAVMIDIGETGREGFYCGPNCSSNRFEAMKIWYSGTRRRKGSTAGLVLDRASSNRFSSLQLQDTTGDGVMIDRGQDNSLMLGVQWQGQIDWMDAPVAALILKGAKNNRVLLNASMMFYSSKAYPAVRFLVRDLASDDATFANGNILDIQSDGWPESAKAFEGPMESSNRLRLDGVMLNSPAKP
ncbi:hypothetical protein BH10PSE5_BH10PSE5_03220 [soil metagenome]